MNKEKKIKNVFIEGPITPAKIADSIAHHQVKTNIGAHDIFLGQVRADVIAGKIVKAIEYSAYEDMANKVFDEIRESAFVKYDLTCAHIYHSKGIVKAGELCLFVFTSSKHRTMAFDACRYITEEIKAKAPVFGKELFEDDSHVWKVNH
ncbi:MAG: molybdenum cofactor biosynthesis protein MoaE [Flavobacteriales bacterium]|nr:molybdenum cofactor biosynthesis protein MoaE [Flavobacteriales bacterium]